MKVIEGLIYVLRQLISVDSDLTNLPTGFLNFHDVYDLFCGFLDTKQTLKNQTFDLSKFLIELETLEEKKI